MVNGSEMPNHWSRYCPSSPRLPSTSSSATPPTTGGSTSGTVTSARRKPRPGTSPRASSQASGMPKSRHSTVARLAQTTDSRSAWPTSGLNSLPGRVVQGAVTSSPASGTSRNTSPITAGSTRMSGRRPRALRVLLTGPRSRLR